MYVPRLNACVKVCQGSAVGKGFVYLEAAEGGGGMGERGGGLTTAAHVFQQF